MKLSLNTERALFCQKRVKRGLFFLGNDGFGNHFSATRDGAGVAA